MRPNGNKLLSTIGLMVTLSILFIGCADSDLLDQETTRYSVVIDPVGADGETITQEVDVVRRDCNSDPTIVEPGLLFPFDVQATISSDSTAAEIIVESYDFTLTPLSGTFGGLQGTERALTASQMPDLVETILNPRSAEISSQVVLPDTSAALNLMIWSAGDKDLYVTYLNSFAAVQDAGYRGIDTVFTYNVEVTLHCRDIENNAFTLTGSAVVTFGSYAVDDECQS